MPTLIYCGICGQLYDENLIHMCPEGVYKLSWVPQPPTANEVLYAMLKEMHDTLERINNNLYDIWKEVVRDK